MASNDENQKAFLERARALADLKFTYVVSCQVYGNQKKSGDIHNRSCYTNILQLMLKYVKVGLILMKYHDIFA
jgi:callose synthase